MQLEEIKISIAKPQTIYLNYAGYFSFAGLNLKLPFFGILQSYHFISINAKLYNRLFPSLS
jgi:hypothetical protein